MERLLRTYQPTDIKLDNDPTDIWPQWYLQFSEPITYRQSDHLPYSYGSVAPTKLAPSALLDCDSQAAHARSGAADRGEGRQAAAAAEPLMPVLLINR